MPFTYNRTVRFQDTDAAGVIYFANILGICHEAYEESLGVSGINLKGFFSNQTVISPIVHASVDFFRPMFCGDNLVITLFPQKLGFGKFEISYEISNSIMITAKAITRHVCIDSNTRTKLELPDEINLWLEKNRRESEGEERRKSREEIM